MKRNKKICNKCELSVWVFGQIEGVDGDLGMGNCMKKMRMGEYSVLPKYKKECEDFKKR